MNFVSIHTHTNLGSMLDALISVDDLFDKVKELGQKAVAITDHGFLASFYDAFKAYKRTGIKFIPGVEMYFVNSYDFIESEGKGRKKTEKRKHIVLLAKNHIGYKNILKINYIGFENQVLMMGRSFPRVNWDVLEKYSEGVICSSACVNGIVSNLILNDKYDDACIAAQKLNYIFKDGFYIEIQPHLLKNEYIDQHFVNEQLISIAQKYNIPLVVGVDVHYLDRQSEKYHDVLLAVKEKALIDDPNRHRYGIDEYYVKSGEEVYDFLNRKYGEDVAKEAVENTVKIAEKCDPPDYMEQKNNHLPFFDPKNESDYDEFLKWRKNAKMNGNLPIDTEYMRFKIFKGFKKKFKNLSKEDLKIRLDRVKQELKILEGNRFSSYMLIVSDFIKWAKSNEISIGCGRGCLSGENLVLTNNGFKRLDSIKIGDYVYTNDGNLKIVEDTFEYNINNERLLEIKTDYSFNNIVLTKDHEVYGAKAVETNKYKTFLEKNNKSVFKCKKYNIGDCKWIPINHLQENDYIFMPFPKKEILDIKKFYFDCSDKSIKYIECDEEFCYIIGRWIGNGCINDKNDSISITVNSNDIEGKSEILNYFENRNFYCNIIKIKDSYKININTLSRLFRKLFPDYLDTSETKYIGNFKYLPNYKLRNIILGIIDSNKYHNKFRVSIDTTNIRLLNDIRESLLYLKILSYVSIRKEYHRGGYLCKQSYKIRFNKLIKNSVTKNRINNNGYFVKIKSKKEIDREKVYDLKIRDNFSYVTQNFLVHNSVAGSLVAYLMDIHNVDSLKYKLIFERFQNAYKKDLPDVDTDITSSGIDLVKQYCINKYGKNKCAAVSNINTYTPKNVIPNLVKSMRNIMPELIPPGENYVKTSNAIKDLILEKDQNGNKIKTLEHAMQASSKLREFSEKCPDLMDYADKLIGIPKEFGTHAAGMVISDIPIVDFAPLRIDKNNVIAVQYEKNRCEDVGLVKMDFLGLKTLDVIDETIKNIKKIKSSDLKYMEDIPLDDKSTYKMIQDGNTKCVFQLGTSNMMISLCKAFKPENITDIAVINALGRPSSSKEERQDYIDRKFGKKEVKYLHPSLEKSLKETYGICVFEEQMMYVAEDLAGWDLSKADGLRKLTKLKGKNPKLAQDLEDDFINGIIEKHNLDHEKAKELWDKVILPFIGYGFNKCLDINNVLLTSNGWKLLSKLNIGDEILILDNDTNKLKSSNIKDIGKTDRQMEVYEVKLREGGLIRCTLNHKFLTPFGYKTLDDIIKFNYPIRKVYNENFNWLENKDNIYGELYNDIKELKKNNSIAKISKQKNISAKKIMTVLKNRKLNRKHEYENRFKNGIIDEETAYWFGFLCADGSINKYSVSLLLVNYDYDHLIKFSKFMKNYNFLFYLRKKENSNSSGIDFIINSKELSDTLFKLGIPYNKNNNKINFDCVPEKLFKHFIRGVFDGDGSVSVFNFFGKRINFGIRGQICLLNRIKNHLMTNINGLYNVKIQEEEKSNYLWFRSLKNVKDILNYLYSDSNIYLDRKKIRFENFINDKKDYKISDNLFRNNCPKGYDFIRTFEKIGIRDTYYVEVDDKNHNYIVDGGIVSANSHAISYSINSYYTAYLKYHYPAEFFAAYLKVVNNTASMTKDFKITMAKNECKRMGVKIIPPDINSSGNNYEVLDRNTIVMGFSAIKGLGNKAVEELVNNQPYSSFSEFLLKTKGRIINKSIMEALAKSGSFDFLNIARKDIFKYGKVNRDKFNIWLKKNYDNVNKDNVEYDEFPLKFENHDWDIKEKLQHERDVFGELISGTLTDLYPGFFTGINTTLISQLKNLPDRHNIIVEFLVINLLREHKITKGRHKNKKMIKYTVSDINGFESELTVWPTEYDLAKKLMKVGMPVRAECQTNNFNGTKTLVLKSIQKIYKNT